MFVNRNKFVLFFFFFAQDFAYFANYLLNLKDFQAFYNGEELICRGERFFVIIGPPSLPYFNCHENEPGFFFSYLIHFYIFPCSFSIQFGWYILSDTECICKQPYLFPQLQDSLWKSKGTIMLYYWCQRRKCKQPFFVQFTIKLHEILGHLYCCCIKYLFHWYLSVHGRLEPCYRCCKWKTNCTCKVSVYFGLCAKPIGS